MTLPPDLVRRLRERVRGGVTEHASLAPFTTFRVGGPADVLVEPEDAEDLAGLAAVVGQQAAVAVVGRGSNLLVSDDGFRGVAVRLGRGFRIHSFSGERMTLGGAVHLPAAARLTARAGLTGFEFAAEIPATFGGAVRMNAGAHGRSIQDVLESATVVDLRTGQRREVSVHELGFAYRHSVLGPAEVVTGGSVLLERADPRDVASRIADHLRWRRKHQPPGLSAGSVFRNPAGDSAGRLIEAAGLKGVRIGGAEVSAVHANFIVVERDARAEDVWRLITRIRRSVADRFGVDLEPEVRFLGDFRQVEGNEGALEGEVEH